GAIRIAGGGSDGYGVGVAEDGVVSRVGDGHAGRHVPDTDRHGDDGGRGGETAIVRGHRGQRVAAGGEGGEGGGNGVGRVVSLAKKRGPVEEGHSGDAAVRVSRGGGDGNIGRRGEGGAVRRGNDGAGGRHVGRRRRRAL